MVQVEYLGETKTFSPQEISSMVLLKVSRSPTHNRHFSDTSPTFTRRRPPLPLNTR